MTRVLIVDDSRLIRKVAQQIVASLGYLVSEAENGRDALAKCEEEMPDAILLDWNMPVMDGLDFLIELRKTPHGKHPKVLFCTTENEVTQITRALKAGADEYIMKPFDRSIIASKFGEVGLAA